MSLNSLNQKVPSRSSRYAHSLYDFLNAGPATRSYCLPCWLRISRPSKQQTRRIRSYPRSSIQTGRRTITTGASSPNHDSPEAESQTTGPDVNIKDATAANPSSESRPSEKLVKSALVRRREKRAKHDEKKRNRKVEPEDYNSPLRVNPWAMILSSAPRMCSFTRARMPEKLMTGFGLVQHPGTSALWLLPTSLHKKQLNKPSNSTSPTPSSKSDESKEGVDALDGENEGGGKTESGHTPKHKIPEMRILSSRAFLDKLSTPKGQGIVKAAIPTRWKENLGATKKAKQPLKGLVWREDMSDHVLLQTRAKALKSLKNIIGREASPVYERDTLKILDRPESATASFQSSLEDGLRKLDDLPDMGKGVVLINNTKQNEPQDVPDLVELPIQKTQVPVFDMGKLFSKTDLEELENHHPVLKEGALFLIPSRKKSAKVAMTLWTLKLYLKDS